MAGETVFLPDHAETLRALALTDCESFYRGELAGKIDAWSRETAAGCAPRTSRRSGPSGWSP